jgi:hypothetical protein
MRVGIVRADVGHMYLPDIENTSQRCFSSQGPGQSRYFHLPTAAEQLAFLNATAYLTIAGSVGAATFNTGPGANILQIRANAADPYTNITVSIGGAVPIAVIVQQLNTGFTTNNLPFVASADSTNHVHIDTKAPNNGPNGLIGLAADATSTLNPIVGFGTGGPAFALTGVPQATFFAVGGGNSVYPTSTTIIVSDAKLIAAYATVAPSSYVAQTAAQKLATVAAFQDFVAPKLIETGPVLMSFVRGDLARWSSTAFKPGGTKGSDGSWIGYAVDAVVGNIAAECLKDDGTAAFTL